MNVYTQALGAAVCWGRSHWHRLEKDFVYRLRGNFSTAAAGYKAHSLRAVRALCASLSSSKRSSSSAA